MRSLGIKTSRTQKVVLAYLLTEDEPVRFGRILKAVEGFSKGSSHFNRTVSVWGGVKDLVRVGLVTVVPNPSHRWAKLYRLTEQGLRYLVQRRARKYRGLLEP